jgi:hypothetical protein
MLVVYIEKGLLIFSSYSQGSRIIISINHSIISLVYWCTNKQRQTTLKSFSDLVRILTRHLDHPLVSSHHPHIQQVDRFHSYQRTTQQHGHQRPHNNLPNHLRYLPCRERFGTRVSTLNTPSSSSLFLLSCPTLPSIHSSST